MGLSTGQEIKIYTGDFRFVCPQGSGYAWYQVPPMPDSRSLLGVFSLGGGYA